MYAKIAKHKMRFIINDVRHCTKQRKELEFMDVISQGHIKEYNFQIENYFMWLQLTEFRCGNSEHDI